MKPAVFFDRDGVLNEDKDYVYKKEDFVWMPDAIAAIKFLQGQGYLIFVVTNQSGIARNYYTARDVEKLHAFMQQQLAEHGAKIDEFYYCPHHPDFTGPCSCRKPAAGMLLEAMQEYDIDKEKSFLLGDNERDLAAAVSAGIAGYFYRTGSLLAKVQEILKKQEALHENV